MKKKKNTIRKSKTGFLYMLPSILLIFILLYFPFFYGIYFSLYDIKYLRAEKFIGIANYVKALGNPLVQKGFLNSVILTLPALSITVAIGLALSLLINHLELKRKTSMFMQIIILIPWITSRPINALLWRWLFVGDWGLIPCLLGSINLQNTRPLEEPIGAMVILIIVVAWRTVGYAVLLLLAGLKSIPGDLYEAAQTDGASAFQQLLNITLPLLKTPLLIVMIVITLSNFNNVVVPLIVTGGGPGIATNVISLELYREAFIYYNFGLASTLAVLVFTLNVIFVIWYMKVMRYQYA